MAVLNPSPVAPLPGVMHLVHRYLLLECRGQRARQDKVKQVLAPQPHIADAAVPAAITAGAAFGLFVIDDDSVKLDSSVRQVGARVEDFAAAARTALMTSMSMEDVVGSDLGARDLSRGLAWFLMQDADRSIVGWTGERNEVAVERLLAQQAKPRAIFVNEERWRPFERWAKFLGFLRGEPSGVVPDPTEAVRVAIRDIQAEESWLEAPEFLRQLAKRLPVLQGGRTRAQVRSVVFQEQLRPEERVEPAFSQALLRLRTDGELQWEARADAGRIVRTMELIDGSTEAFSHVTIGAST